MTEESFIYGTGSLFSSWYWFI